MQTPAAIASKSALLAASAFVIMGLLAPSSAPAQQQPSAPKAYKPVTITLPKAVTDPSFAAFRKQVAEIAGKKDRAALTRIIAQKFFWIPEDKDVADARKSGFDNLSAAIGLDGNDAPGWDLLVGYAQDPTADPHPQLAGVICGPGEPGFDDKAAEELAKATDTEPSEWGYPA